MFIIIDGILLLLVIPAIKSEFRFIIVLLIIIFKNVGFSGLLNSRLGLVLIIVHVEIYLGL